MFIKVTNQGYTKDGAQFATGKYVAFFSDADMKQIWAFCPKRVVRLEQLGHWMMGHIRVDDHQVSISGSAGHDGLPLDIDKLPDHVKNNAAKYFKLLPASLAEEYRRSEGWNDIGPAVTNLRTWARQEFGA